MPALLAVLAHPDDESFGPGGTLALYARRGYDVHIAIATDGAAGSVVAGYEDARSELATVRAKELERAVTMLGGRLHRLGYRDSGYTNDPANNHPDALIQADPGEATGKIVRLIREHRPLVVLTHDETGGYFHPDHIFCWRVTTAAFHAAGDPAQYPARGLAPFQPQRLYYTVLPSRWIKFAAFLMWLRGQDPRRAGRNKDIDLTRLGVKSERITAVIDIRPTWEVKRAAAAAHSSQGGGTSFNRLLPNWLQKQLFGRETFMRAYPPPSPGRRERDLFPPD